VLQGLRKDGGVTEDVALPLGALPDLAPASGLGRRRRMAGLVLGLLLPVALTAALLELDSAVGLAGDALVLMVAVVVTALVGGLWAAVVCALLGSTMLNYWFIPPVRTFQIGEPHNYWTVVAFVLVGLLVSTVVHRAASTATAAARAAAEARTLSDVAKATLRGEDALPTLLEHMRRAFGMTSASLLRRDPSGSGTWQVVAARGPEAPREPALADVHLPAGEDLVIALCGRPLSPSDRAILGAFAAQAQALLERDELARAAALAARMEASERLRDALLAAVGHDLRTPLASATAAVTSLRSRDVTWSEDEREELLATADESLSRLATLVSDLLDLSRLRAGVLSVLRQTLWLDELLPPVLDELGPEAAKVVVDLPEQLPAVVGDAALVMRVLVNVIGNALRHAPTDADPPELRGQENGDCVELHVIDHGAGVPARDRERIFSPFQRLGDTDNTAGLGIGLALSRGLVEAMGGTLEATDTPNGGLTMVLALPAAPGTAAAVAPAIPPAPAPGPAPEVRP
jgi:two-component system sensor histidine kinase KdpD